MLTSWCKQTEYVLEFEATHAEFSKVSECGEGGDFESVPWVSEATNKKVMQQMDSYQKMHLNALRNKRTATSIKQAMKPEEDDRVQRLVQATTSVLENVERMQRLMATVAFANILVAQPRSPSFLDELKAFVAHFKKAQYDPRKHLPTYLKHLFNEAMDATDSTGKSSTKTADDASVCSTATASTAVPESSTTTAAAGVASLRKTNSSKLGDVAKALQKKRRVAS